MQRVWIVIVNNNWGTKVSSEGYKTAEEAIAFVQSRGDRPEQINPLEFESSTNNYKITDITIR